MVQKVHLIIKGMNGDYDLTLYSLLEAQFGQWWLWLKIIQGSLQRNLTTKWSIFGITLMLFMSNNISKRKTGLQESREIPQSCHITKYFVTLASRSNRLGKRTTEQQVQNLMIISLQPIIPLTSISIIGFNNENEKNKIND